MPENVQQRMDPSLAKKYQMGGSVMQRPLFRQMGGPAQMMPQDMMPPPPMAGAPMAPPPMAPPPMDPMAEQMMAAESMGQSAGEDVANAMMMQIDGAQDYESLIDGIRGNELPLDARYQELAGLVGEADAMATPESVLALTQPTIMMTEQGAMDSGIGELMQGIAGEIEMEGPMDEGVGSLMAAGAGNTPPVNFRNGGPVEVRGYQAAGEVKPGGGSRIMAQAERDVSDYEKYLAGGFDQQARAADLEEQKRMSQAQMLFDIAGTALNFAGQTQGGSVAERLANAATQSQLTEKIGSRSAGILDAKRAQAAEDRQLRMAARQASLSQAQTDEQNRQELLLAGVRSKKTAPTMETIYTVDAEGNPKIYKQFDMKDDTDIAAYNALIDPENQAKLEIKIFNSESIKPFIKAQETRLTNAIQDQKMLSTELIVTKPFSVTRDGKKVDFKTGELGFFTQNEFNNNAQSLGSIASGTERVTLYPIDGKGKPVDFPKTSTQIAVLTGTDGGYTQDPAAYVSYIGEQKDMRKSDLDVKVKIAEEARLLKTQLAVEERLLSKTINEEKRALLKLIAKEKRAEIKLIQAERRAKDTTLGSEERALATQIEKEARDELTAIVKEGREFEAEIAKEKRLLETTIAAEEREANKPYTKTLNNRLVLINPTKPENKQVTVLADLSDTKSVFGNSPRAKAATIVSDEELLAKYATGTLDKAVDGVSTAEMETAFQIYTGPVSTEYSETLKRDIITPGGKLNDAQIQVLRARSAFEPPLSVPTDVYFPADDIDGIVNRVLNQPKLKGVAPLGDLLSDAAWGSRGFARNLINIGVEVLTFPAPFGDTKDAKTAVLNLNQEFETVFLAAQNIRDSVFQGKKLEALTPDPVKFWLEGPDAARSKAFGLYMRLGREIDRIEKSINSPDVPMKETGGMSYGTKKERLPVLYDLREGYKILAEIDIASRGGNVTDINQAEQSALYQELLRKSSTPKEVESP